MRRPTRLERGGDITLTNSLVATTRYGYYFENYHDFDTRPQEPSTRSRTMALLRRTPVEFAACGLQESSGFTNLATDGSFTHRNSEKAIQFDQDVAWYHGGKGGTTTSSSATSYTGTPTIFSRLQHTLRSGLAGRRGTYSS